MDAQANDYVSWGPLRLTGGVQQWWSESHWAYWAPMSSLVSSLGWLSVTGGGFLTAMAVVFDTPFMLTARYGHDDSGQLLIQLLRGRAGVAAVNNYNIDFDTGEATGNIAVFRISYDGEGSLKELVYWTLKAGTGVEVGTDPLVIDLDGDGIELVRQADGVYFDIDNDGFAEKAGWVSGDDGLLARDLNGNGLIDNQGELFGNASLSGFAALAALDSNADGAINSLDADFTALRVWRDLDKDGKTDAGELKTLVETGITSISLTTTTPASSQLAGNPITAQSTVTFANGQAHVIADVILANNQADSVYLGDSTVSSTAAALPILKGFGNVKNLDVAMTGDAALLALVDSFKDLPATTSWAAFKAAADDVLFRWAGVDGVSPVAMTGGFDRQKLAFLEAYTGIQLTPRDAQGVPSLVNVQELIDMWNDTLDKATVRLAAQGPLEDVFGDLTLNLSFDAMVLPASTTLADIYKNAIQNLSSTPATALAEWNDSWGPLLSESSGMLVRSNGVAVRSDFQVASLVRALSQISSPLSLAQLAAGLAIANIIIGTQGNDALARGSAEGTQVFVGEAGNDTLTGGADQDVYVFGSGFGQDTIVDVEAPGKESGDRIRFRNAECRRRHDQPEWRRPCDSGQEFNRHHHDQEPVLRAFDDPVRSAAEPRIWH